MANIATFTPDSISLLARALGLNLEQISFNSSRVLGRQLKCAMHILLKECTKQVLDGFGEQLKKRDGTKWPLVFCVVALLCWCAGDVQIAAVRFSAYDMNSHNGSHQSYQMCKNLEDHPYRQCIRLFHDMYGTHKLPNGHSDTASFNPIFHANARSGWTPQAEQLVSQIRGIMDTRGKLNILTDPE